MEKIIKECPSKECPSNENLKLIEIFLQNSFDGIFIIDNKGNLLFVNPTLEKLLDTKKHELVGRQVSELIQSGVYEGSPTLETIKTKEPHTGLVKTRAGLEILSTSKPIFNEKGEVEYAIANCRPLKPLQDFLSSYEEGKLIKKYDATVEDSAELIYSSNIMSEMMKKALQIARSDSSVIVYGETGSGKGQLVKYIHANSARRKNRMVEINCAAIPENLFESELFGYDEGAFTGANVRGKQGLFEIADGGTLFLDEIDEMPLLLQAKLLKVLDEGYFIRVGGTISRKTNARVIVATNSDLKNLIKEGKFREDLYYRLNIMPLRMPSLRERKEDIEPLIEYILENLNKRMESQKYFSEESTKLMQNYDWPGNVRQLKNVVERLCVLSDEDEITLDERLLHQDDDLYDSIETSDEFSDLKSYLRFAEKKYIKQTLEQCKGNISAAANKLGIHRTALYKKIDSKES